MPRGGPIRGGGGGRAPRQRGGWRRGGGGVFAADYAEGALREQFKLLSLEGCGLGGKKLAVGAAGAILHYARETQKSALAHLERPTWYDRADALVLDAATVRNLELTEPLFA